MKKLVLSIGCALMAVTANAQWNNLNVNMTYDGFINDIEAVDASVVWGHPWQFDGTNNNPTADYVRTTDGGSTWTIGTVNGVAGHEVGNIWPIDANTCYVSMYNPTGAGGEIFKTTNGGTSWSQASTAAMFAQTTSFANVVYFWNPANGKCMGDPAGPGPAKYEIWLTADSGSTWTRVPAANLPSLTNAGEYGITNLFSAADGRVWFGTTYGDVVRSIDGGNTWTKHATGLPANNTANGRFDVTDIAFSDSLNGLVLQVATAGNTWRKTTDGGLTWTTVVPTGNAYINDIDGVPGTNIFVSSGSSTTGGFGTSYSNDRGATWNDIDIGASHTGIDFVSSTVGFSGEFVTAGPVGGAWNFTGSFASIACGDTSISPGVATVNDTLICFGDTLLYTVNGALAPTVGAVHGFSLIVSGNDISNSTDPLNVSGLPLGGTGVIFPAPNPFPIMLVNDGTIFPPGNYYITPVVYGNATGTGTIITAGYTLDPNCTYTGTSTLVYLLPQGDPLCVVGVNNNNANFNALSVYPNPVSNQVNVSIASTTVNTNAQLIIKDVVGKVVYSQPVSVTAGQNNISVSMKDQSAGIYFVTFKNGSTTSVQKFVKE